jgi:hypothetical protein
MYKLSNAKGRESLQSKENESILLISFLINTILKNI